MHFGDPLGLGFSEEEIWESHLWYPLSDFRAYNSFLFSAKQESETATIIYSLFQFKLAMSTVLIVFIVRYELE